MKKQILKKSLVTLVAIMILRYIYVDIMNEPYINGVFISTTLGLLLATSFVTIAFYKHNTK